MNGKKERKKGGGKGSSNRLAGMQAHSHRDCSLFFIYFACLCFQHTALRYKAAFILKELGIFETNFFVFEAFMKE